MARRRRRSCAWSRCCRRHCAPGPSRARSEAVRRRRVHASRDVVDSAPDHPGGRTCLFQAIAGCLPRSAREKACRSSSPAARFFRWPCSAASRRVPAASGWRRGGPRHVVGCAGNGSYRAGARPVQDGRLKNGRGRTAGQHPTAPSGKRLTFASRPRAVVCACLAAVPDAAQGDLEADPCQHAHLRDIHGGREHQPANLTDFLLRAPMHSA